MSQTLEIFLPIPNVMLLILSKINFFSPEELFFNLRVKKSSFGKKIYKHTNGLITKIGKKNKSTTHNEVKATRVSIL